jgi:hypothetical protein
MTKSFCKVCFDSGKTESEYTNHFVKSNPGPTGKIVCPTLLSLECRYCFKKGHTVSHCAVLSKNKKREEYIEKKIEKVEKTCKKVENRFSNLLDDNSDSEEDKEEEEELFCRPSSPVEPPPPCKTYASVLLSVKKEEKEEKEEKYIVKKIVKKPVVVNTKKISWADYESSDDEDECEEYLVEEDF